MTENNRSKEIRRLTTAAVCFALCMVLPFITGQIPEIGMALSPMHIPVLIAGFVVGPIYATVIGFFAPLVRFMWFQFPPMPNALAMSFELAAYGVVSGILYRVLPKKVASIYISLIVAMLVGRVIWGAARVIMLGLMDTEFSWEMFIGSAFVGAVPGIVLHIVVIPVIIIALKRAGLMLNEETFRFRKTNKVV